MTLDLRKWETNEEWEVTKKAIFKNLPGGFEFFVQGTMFSCDLRADACGKDKLVYTVYEIDDDYNFVMTITCDLYTGGWSRTNTSAKRGNESYHSIWLAVIDVFYDCVLDYHFSWRAMRI